VSPRTSISRGTIDGTALEGLDAAGLQGRRAVDLVFLPGPRFMLPAICAARTETARNAT